MDSRLLDEEGAALASLREAALQATDVSFVLAEAGPGTPIVWVNDAFTRTTGWTLEEVVGREPRLLHDGLTDAGPVEVLRDAIRHERSVTATVRNRRKDGSPFWNQVSLTPVRAGDGRVTHWIGVQVEVTGHVDAAEDLRRSVEEERRARRGLTLVVQASDLLSDVEDPYVLREICTLLQREMVTWAGFYLLYDGELRPADGVGGAPPQPLDGPSREPGGASRRSAPRVVGPDPVADLVAGRTVGPVELDVGEAGAAVLGPWTQRLLDELRRAPDGPGRPHGVAVHAVPGRKGVLGVLAVAPRCNGGRARLDEDDRAILRLVARRVGMVVDNSRLYAREHTLAETLQRAMLPDQARVDGLDVWTYYAPSSTHAQVGGDWYDVLEADADHVALVIGDVVGHDIEAAAAMGQLRSIVRAYAFDSADPAEVLRRVDHLVAGMRLPRPASLALVTLVRGDDDWFARYTRAGHLPPLLVRGDHVEQLRDGAGALVGFGTGDRHAGTVVLEPGDVLVLYTDGLVERRGRRLRDGLDGLVDVARGIAGLDAAGVGEELLQRLADAPEDDVAVVVVRVPDPTGRRAPRAGSTRRRRWSFADDPMTIGDARRAVVTTCEQWGLPGASSAELVASELVANAVMHGWGRVILRLLDTGDGLRIEVEDSNPAPPVPTDGHAGRIGGYGMRIVERLGEWGWRPTASGKVVWARVRPEPLGGPETSSAARS